MRVLLAFLAAAFCAGSAIGQTYVAASGSDAAGANRGTAGLPYATLSAAVAAGAVAVRLSGAEGISAGAGSVSVYGDGVIIESAGGSAAPATLVCSASGATCLVVSGAGSVELKNLIIDGTALSGLATSLRPAFGGCLRVEGGALNLTLTSVVFKGCAAG